MTKAEQAAKMRNEGKSIDEIAKHFGWTRKYTYIAIWSGRNRDVMLALRRKHSATDGAKSTRRNWYLRNGVRPNPLAWIENTDKRLAREYIAMARALRLA